MAAGPEMIPDIGSIKRSAIKRGYHYTSYETPGARMGYPKNHCFE